MTELEFKLDFLLGIEGQSPFSYQTTMKALSFIERLSRRKKVVNIGCGTGYQSVALYEAIQSPIIAIDDVPEFIDYLKKEFAIQKLENHIYPILSNPYHLPFMSGTVDIIWSEYTAANLGFEYSINKWNHFLKEEGYLGVCAYCWLTNDPPSIITNHWNTCNKDIDSIVKRIQQIESAGYIPITYFILPDECWWNYFCSMEQNFEPFLKKHKHHPLSEMLVSQIDSEIDLYEKYGEYYGYLFFICQKKALNKEITNSVPILQHNKIII